MKIPRGEIILWARLLDRLIGRRVACCFLKLVNKSDFSDWLSVERFIYI